MISDPLLRFPMLEESSLPLAPTQGLSVELMERLLSLLSGAGAEEARRGGDPGLGKIGPCGSSPTGCSVSTCCTYC